MGHFQDDPPRYEILLNTIPHMVWATDEQGQAIYANRQTISHMGVDVSRLLGWGWLQLVHPDDIPHVRDQWLQAVASRAPYVNEYRLRDAEGRYRWYLAQALPVHTEGGDLDMWVGTWTDIDGLHATTEQLRALSAKIQSAREQEGLRIARELHDDLGGSLSAIKWDLERLASSVGGPCDSQTGLAVQQRLTEIAATVAAALQSVQCIASELRPSMLDDLGLIEAVVWQSQEFESRTGIVCRCTRDDHEPPVFSPGASTAIFRVFQEALTNVLRHAQATSVDVRMTMRNEMFILSIGDNGRGIQRAEAAAPTALGIVGMRERAMLIGATLELIGTPGRGTEVVLRVPRAAAAARSTA